MSLVFETAAAVSVPDPQRADVACFVGYVARRTGQPLPADMRAQIAAAGWVAGIWRRPAEQVESLLNIPLVVDGWDLFDTLFAWDTRPLRANDDAVAPTTGLAVCATYLGAAVRSFFARGGRRAVIVRVGDPWPLIEPASTREAARRDRLRALVPDFADRTNPARLFAPHDPSAWRGLQHLYGLREVSLLLLPDLPDACSTQDNAARTDPPPPAVATGFVECSTNESPPPDTSLRRIPAPRLDSNGFAAWQLALRASRAFLARHQREVMLLAALPLPQADTQRVSDAAYSGQVHAQADMLAYLQRIGVIKTQPVANGDDPGSASALIQLAWPWLRTQSALDLPESLEAPDGVLAGLVSASAIARGTVRSVAGDFSTPRLRDVGDAEPVPSWELGDDSHDAQLARHVCLFAQQPEGWSLQSDVTLSCSAAWRSGGASRLMGSILRAARAA
ncbi:MAG: phage tail protein, partial [Rhodoferax sp.]|nr:phage tail protein [Rhodoferax sp.]